MVSQKSLGLVAQAGPDLLKVRAEKCPHFTCSLRKIQLRDYLSMVQFIDFQQSPCDFTILVGVVVVIVLCFSAFGILMIFFYARLLHMVYCSIGILIASLCIVIGKSLPRWHIADTRYYRQTFTILHDFSL